MTGIRNLNLTVEQLAQNVIVELTEIEVGVGVAVVIDVVVLSDAMETGYFGRVADGNQRHQNES